MSAWPEFTHLDPGGHVYGPVSINPANVAAVEHDERGCIIHTNAPQGFIVKESRADVLATLDRAAIINREMAAMQKPGRANEL